MSLSFIPSIIGSYQRVNERMISFSLYFLKITVVKRRIIWEAVVQNDDGEKRWTSHRRGKSGYLRHRITFLVVTGINPDVCVSPTRVSLFRYRHRGCGA